jgi:hypothetical protein
VLLAVTHTDAIEPKYEPAGLLHILGQRVDELGEAANDPPSLIRSPVCVPRYDDPVAADEARSCLIRAIEQQVPAIVLIWSLGFGRAPALVRSPVGTFIAAGCWSIYV